MSIISEEVANELNRELDKLGDVMVKLSPILRGTQAQCDMFSELLQIECDLSQIIVDNSPQLQEPE